MADFSLYAPRRSLLQHFQPVCDFTSMISMPILSRRDGHNDSMHMMDENELDKETLDPVDLREQPTDYSVTDSAFIQIRTTTSNKKRRRYKKEPSIDEVTQISK